MMCGDGRVVRPLVADLRAQLGLPPPADLLGLPMELCHIIFKDLQAVPPPSPAYIRGDWLGVRGQSDPGLAVIFRRQCCSTVWWT